MKKFVFALAVIMMSAVSSAQAATSFTCVGDKWYAKQNGVRLVVDGPVVEKPQTLKIVSVSDPVGHDPQAGLAKVIKTKFTTLTVIKAPGCSDESGETEYTHYAVYDFGGTIHYGCCNLK